MYLADGDIVDGQWKVYPVNSSRDEVGREDYYAHLRKVFDMITKEARKARIEPIRSSQSQTPPGFLSGRTPLGWMRLLLGPTRESRAYRG